MLPLPEQSDKIFPHASAGRRAGSIKPTPCITLLSLIQGTPSVLKISITSACFPPSFKRVQNSDGFTVLPVETSNSLAYASHLPVRSLVPPMRLAKK